jgi:hypothetical protein
VIFAVTLERGGPWDWSLGLREQSRGPTPKTPSTRLADDPWDQHGMLAVTSIRPWTVLLDGLGVIREGAGS